MIDQAKLADVIEEDGAFLELHKAAHKGCSPNFDWTCCAAHRGLRGPYEALQANKRALLDTELNEGKSWCGIGSVNWWRAVGRADVGVRGAALCVESRGQS